MNLDVYPKFQIIQIEAFRWLHDWSLTTPWLQLLQKTRFFKFKSCNPLSESVSVRVSLEEKRDESVRDCRLKS